MALVKCPECQSEVSGSATACPKCGHPLKRKPLDTGTGCLILIIIFFMCVVGIMRAATG